MIDFSTYNEQNTRTLIARVEAKAQVLRQVLSQFSQQFPQAERDVVNIGLMHLLLECNSMVADAQEHLEALAGGVVASQVKQCEDVA